MNIQLLKYALEVSQTGSMTKAAANLYMSQPNLSRAIRELEDIAGVPLFKRTSKGIFPTSEGEDFLIYARSILQQIDELETRYQQREQGTHELRICAPRTSYISCTMANFIAGLDRSLHIDVHYKETNAMRAISNMIQGDYDLSIIRYPLEYESYFLNFFREKELKFENVWEFKCAVLLSADNPLAQKKRLARADFDSGVELVYGDPYIPSLPLAEVRKTIQCTTADNCVAVYDRSSAFILLDAVHDSFLWTAPVPTSLLRRYELVQRKCDGIERMYKDVAVYHTHHKLSTHEQQFLEALKVACAELDERRYF